MANSVHAYNAGGGNFELDFVSDAVGPDGTAYQSTGISITLANGGGGFYLVTGTQSGSTWSGGLLLPASSGVVFWSLQRNYGNTGFSGESGSVDMSAPFSNPHYVPAVML